MKQKILLFLLIGLFLGVFANAEICDYAKDVMGIQVGTEIPRFMPYKNEVFNIYSGEEVIGSIIVEKGNVTFIECDQESENPTYNLFIKELDTIQSIFESENYIDEFNEKIKNKELEFKGTSIGKSIKGFFTRVVARVVGWFV